jgi:hypothetical protein
MIIFVVFRKNKPEVFLLGLDGMFPRFALFVFGRTQVLEHSWGTKYSGSLVQLHF